MEIKDYSLPIHIKDPNDYKEAIKDKIDFYLNNFKQLINVDYLSKYKKKLNQSIELSEKQASDLYKIIDCYLHGKESESLKILKKIINKNKKTIIKPINEAYGFLGNMLYVKKNDKIENLFMYRGRHSNSYENLNAKELLHIPLNKREMVSTFRYSIPGIPALYLACNSYISWCELRRPILEELTISYFNLNKIIDKKIIDISYYIDAFYDTFMDEIYCNENVYNVKIMIDVIKIIPLIIACLVVCDIKTERKFKIEYLFPQMLMQFINEDCIGIAYRSARIENSKCISTNLAIPIIDFNEQNNYGTIMDKIDISNPINIGYFRDFIYRNNKFNIYNTKAKGPSASKNNYNFIPNMKNVYLNFNRYVGDLSYDNQTHYNQTCFFWFDEYLLFLEESKKLSDII